MRIINSRYITITTKLETINNKWTYVRNGLDPHISKRMKSNPYFSNHELAMAMTKNLQKRIEKEDGTKVTVVSDIVECQM